MVDAFPMPDLSEMLGDVYGEPEEPVPTAPSSGSATPEWADDEHLDRAFAEWTPGPDADAPAAERGMFAPAQAAPGNRLADDLAAALSEAVLAESTEEDDGVETEAAHHDVVETPEPLTSRSLADLEPEVAREPEPAPAPAPMTFPAHKAGWQRSDDDILPTGKAAKGGVRLPRPTRAGKAPKTPTADAGPKKARRSFGDLMKMEIGGSKKKK